MAWYECQGLVEPACCVVIRLGGGDDVVDGDGCVGSTGEQVPMLNVLQVQPCDVGWVAADNALVLAKVQRVHPGADGLMWLSLVGPQLAVPLLLHCVLQLEARLHLLLRKSAAKHQGGVVYVDWFMCVTTTFRPHTQKKHTLNILNKYTPA